MGRINAMARYREMGYELQQLRENAGLSGADMAQRMGWSRAKIGRVELGQSEINIFDMIEYLGHCEIYRAQALDLLAKCRDAAACSHGYWLSPHENDLQEMYSLIYHETTASTSACYEPQVIPGLLQTESFIRAMTAERYPHRDADLAVSIRMERQGILHRKRPAQFTFYISEQALRLKLGDTAVMQEQLLALTLLDALPHLAIRVVPASATFGGAFRLFTYTKYRPLVYLDAYVGGLFLEDKNYVDSYRSLIPVIADAALNEMQSREFMAALAYDHDRVEEK